ncbi:UDP-3-O-acyl-N-acetylglucosamine deacetylase [Palleronia sediminis]|uniref:UDP-3-O-acyl-N-acetylglucosamine deacetylase n=1 Tax=Palleronia sediminis TaxID=2547833 RepID=A0A4R6AJR7_9RHOB|nr:UDP-3-O-acyl-N-acetylglucosamine deacetylase [Palleronia sediminis]TDL81986.1 UDP-3-O-acyl-N-acetylglucosamine deacetylase [Palleronia sediminis]
MQTTLKSVVSFEGVGLHSGQPVRMRLKPAAAELGVWFRRTDIVGRATMIPAIWSAVVPGELCTRIVNEQGVSVSTVEHVMAAIAGCGLHNVEIEIDGPEVPILDGSSAPFVAFILRAGLREQASPIRALEILDRVEVRNGPALARLEPAEGIEMAFHIDFEDAAIGVQDKRLNLANGTFVHELCDSRTFCRQSDVDAMRARGLALGGTLENAVVVDGARVLTPGGLRHVDEAVRHKMLDAMGDLALAGGPILGRYTGVRAGHAMTNALLRALFARPGAARMIEVDARRAACLPGAGLVRADAPLRAA